MPLNLLGGERGANGGRAVAPVTRPPINLPDLDDKAIEAEAAEAAAKIKTIRLGRDAWEAVGRAESFEAWKRIGAALAVGKAHALRVSGGSAWGRNYSREFNLWVRQHGFDKVPAATRSVAVELHEHAEQITQWRDGLPERQRKRLIHPLSVTRRWKAATAHCNGKCSQDLRRDAKAAWARFCACARALPADEAQPLWRLIAAEATVHIS
jgi:hypothetical protein